MRYPVCTVSPALARAWSSIKERVPFLPPASTAPSFPVCACGAELDMEMEKDEGRCVDCAFQAAEAGFRRKA